MWMSGAGHTVVPFGGVVHRQAPMNEMEGVDWWYRPSAMTSLAHPTMPASCGTDNRGEPAHRLTLG
jgi:hypothetical protein